MAYAGRIKVGVKEREKSRERLAINFQRVFSRRLCQEREAEESLFLKRAFDCQSFEGKEKGISGLSIRYNEGKMHRSLDIFFLFVTPPIIILLFYMYTN